MLFNSFHYALFFPLVLVAYFAIPHRARWALLLAASYYFYACWRVEYLGLLLLSTSVDYVGGLRIAAATTPRAKRAWLAASLAANLGLLFTFKYAGFALASVQQAFDAFNVMADVPAFQVLLPVGISFYTFQSLSYTIDVYRGAIAPERHPGRFALYVAFFPQLVAGPIERATHLLPQFLERHAFSYDDVAVGLRLMLWGYWKKLVVADNLAGYVDVVYGDPTQHRGPLLLIASYLFAFQIYCDFSGYSDIAIGSARALGFRLSENFRRPYLAGSVREFWQRWHISLSTWFRDYVYLPLGGNRASRARVGANLLLVFLLSGLWHGASWTFVVWGALHGAYYLVGTFTRPWRDRLGAQLGAERWPRLRAVLRALVTFHLVLLAWVFFRSRSLGDAWHVLGELATGLGSSWRQPVPGGVNELDLAYGLIGLAVLLGVELLQARHPAATWLERRPRLARWLVYQAAIIGILLLGARGEHAFIYFQF
jgi:alginate O-acetyltransferase complex protein AlgI